MKYIVNSYSNGGDNLRNCIFESDIDILSKRTIQKQFDFLNKHVFIFLEMTEYGRELLKPQLNIDVNFYYQSKTFCVSISGGDKDVKFVFKEMK